MSRLDLAFDFPPFLNEVFVLGAAGEELNEDDEGNENGLKKCLTVPSTFPGPTTPSDMLVESTGSRVSRQVLALTWIW